MKKHIDENIKQNKIRKFVDYLKIKRSNFGEVSVFELLVQDEESLQISEEKEKLIKESLIKYSGNIFPVIIRSIRSEKENYFRYEVIGGKEFCKIAKILVKELGEKEAGKLGIDRLKVWLLELEDEEISPMLKEIQTLINSIKYF